MADRLGRNRPMRLTLLIAGTLFVVIGTVLMAVRGSWPGVGAGVGGLLLLAGVWSAEIRPPVARMRRVDRSVRARWSRWTIVAGLLLAAVCTAGSLIIGNPTMSFFGATILISQTLALTGPLYAVPWREP